MKTLIIIPYEPLYNLELIKDEDITIFPCFKPNYVNHSKMYNLLPTFCVSLYTNIIDFRKYEKIIIFDSVLNYSLKYVKYVISRNKNKKIILYKWNNITKNDLMLKKINKIRNRIEVYDYDDLQAKKYDFKKTNIVCNDQYLKQYNSENSKIYDLVYLGRCKDRLAEIVTAYEILVESGIEFKMILHGTNYLNYNFNESVEFINGKNITYNEYLTIIDNTNLLLDITNNGQESLTIRFLEALYLNKKIITNNKYYLNTSFRDSKNVLYIDKSTSKNSIIKFVNQPIEEYDDELKIEYSFKNWCNNLK